MTTLRDKQLKKLAAEFGLDFAEETKPLPNYAFAVEHDGVLHVSGKLPRIRGAVAVQGRVGGEISLEDGRRAARIAVVRALVVVRHHVGSLVRVDKVLRMNVYVQSAPNFTEQSEVADAASSVVYELFEPDGAHARTSVGVYQLPKNAAVEIDLTVALGERDAGYSTF